MCGSSKREKVSLVQLYGIEHCISIKSHCIAKGVNLKFLDLERTNDDDDDDDDDEQEMDAGEVGDGEELQDMGAQISKLKKIFNEDMPRVRYPSHACHV